MDYKGMIIEESLDKRDILQQLRILRKRKEPVTTRHQTPWLRQWTIDTIIIPEHAIEEVVERLSVSLDTSHDSSWYIDFKNDKYHYIVFPHKIFKVDLQNPVLYQEAEAYGITLGIPSYQMGFEKLQRKRNS